MGRHRIPPELRGNAKRLRQAMTSVEQLLWSRLRAHRFQDIGFRRQVPMGPFVVDFICHSHRLVVELDGGQHADPEQAARDLRRTRFLEGEGYRVVRFWNTELVENIEAVLYRIGVELGLPDPSG